MLDNVKKYSCSNCNEAFDAYPPDDIYTRAKIIECYVCKYLTRVQIKRIVECKNCDHPNILYWHMERLHTVGEHNDAKRKRAEASGLDLVSPTCKRITLNKN